MNPARHGARCQTARVGVGLALGLLSVVPATGARADEPRVYVVDPAQSRIAFRATSRFMDGNGTFGRFGGEIRLDVKRPEAAAARVTVEVASLNTGIGMRDNHLRSDDFFDVERHPTATFVTSTVRREGIMWRATGHLTIRGVTREVTVPVTLTRVGATIQVAGEFSINRRDFGVSYTSFFNPIRNEVEVAFNLTAVVQ